MKQKRRKSLVKRFKVTKNGKILRRLSGLNHYLAKKSGERSRKSRKLVELSKAETKLVRKLMH